MTAPDCNGSGAIKTSTLQIPPSFPVAKQRFLESSTKYIKCRNKADLVWLVNKHFTECRNQFNNIIICNNRVDFVERILRDTKSALFCFYVKETNEKCRSPPYQLSKLNLRSGGKIKEAKNFLLIFQIYT